MLRFLQHLDRRWIFLLMFLAVAIPVLTGVTFPEKPSEMSNRVFDAIQDLPNGSVVLMAFDFDPASKGELQPMASALTRHCAEKGHRMLFMTLWPQGVPMVQDAVNLLQREYPHYRYGKDFVNLGFQPGGEGVIKVIVGDVSKLFSSDVHGTHLSDLPLTADLKSIQQVQLLVNVSAGTPGSKEWIQYASTPFGILTVAGSTGVQAPSLYPYIPQQLAGILAAIKGAAEYEQRLIIEYPHLRDNENAQEGLRRMGPQMIAHILMVGLIILGNVVYFSERRKA